MFFVFEGIDGCGKSTQTKLLETYLAAERGLSVLRVREPGGTELGESLRRILLDPRPDELSPETEMFLFMAARAHLVQHRILPALRAGKVVISDRFLWSSAAYQGGTGRMSPTEILRVGELAVGEVEMTQVFFIDLAPKEAAARSTSDDRMERRGLEFQARVRDHFLSLVKKNPETATLIDGRGSPRRRPRARRRQPTRSTMSSTFLPRVQDQALARDYFERAFASERLSHAYLFWGAEGSGKGLFAGELAKAIHCKHGQPCGDCVVCQSIDHGNHPAVHVFGPAEGKSIIDVETVRNLCERLRYKSEDKKIVILEQADLLNESAANALLKTLEEPPGDTLLILIARSTGSLLTTIVSRCHRIPFRRDTSSAVGSDPGVEKFFRDVQAAEFFADEDPKKWLGGLYPDASTDRESVRTLLESLISAHSRPESLVASPDDAIERLDDLLELATALAGNVSADLVLEKLFTAYRR